ncbi:MAG: flagellar motor protein [Methylococcales bacterium]|nr:flagellar motor protein [Methylococcales bacterium]
MNLLSIFGLLVGIGAVLIGNKLDGGHIGSLLNGSAFVIVFGGTLGAVCLQFPPAVFFKSLKVLIRVFLPHKIHLKAEIDKIVRWSGIARKNGFLDLEKMIAREEDSLVKKGLQLLVDGTEPAIIRDTLEVELFAKEYADLQIAKVYESMGGYAPTIGIIGAVMGLIHVMQNLSEPALLGEGIATAFVATIYGVASANLIFLPIAQQLKSQVYAQTQAREMMMEGLVAIAAGENSRNIELKLSGFITEPPH